jgi:sigma-B regulation protein RsbU (phosphoserine phosphatase)
LNEVEGAFTIQDEALLRQFAAHVAVAIENATLFESERRHNDTLEALAEIGREMSSILDLDALLTRIANLTKRLIDYRTFGILLLNEATQELEMKLAVSYGKDAAKKHMKLGEGLVGWAAQHKEALLVADVAQDPRYVNLVDDARSELVVPLLIKDRCIGVFDLESPELEAFNKEHKELMTLLASQAAVAIENARLYEEVRRNEERIEKELRFAQRVQAALLPSEPPTRIPEADVAGRFASARELGGDLHDFLAPDPSTLVVAVGDVSGKGAPAALYGAFAAELVRSRTMRRRFTPDRFSVSGVLQVMNTILQERQLRSTTARSATRSSTSRTARSRSPTPGFPTRSAARATRAARSSCRACRSDRFPASPTTRRRSSSIRATSSCSARTASSRRSTSRASSSAPAACARSCARIAPAPRARSSMPSSTPSPRSAATPRRTTT